MHKKGIVFLFSLFLLAACGGENTTETDSEEPVVESVAETEGVDAEEPNDNAVDVTNVVHTYDGLVDDTTFSEESGLQAWDDYQAIVQDIVLGEVTTDAEEINATTRSELEGFIEKVDLRDDIFQDEVEVSEDEEMVFYRYPPAEDSGYSEVAQFLAEMTFFFYDDNLMFTAITPGFYSVELDDLPSADDLALFLTVEEIKEFNPKIYTIAEMQVNDEKIQQIMTPAMSTDEEGNEMLMAFYFFTKGDDILKYGFLPFEMVSQDFPTSSLLVFQEIVPTLEEL